MARPCKMRAWLAQATVRALFGEGAATLAVTRSSMTKRGTVCRTPVHLSVIVTRQNQDTREVVVRGYVGEVVISCGAEVIAGHRRSYERDDFVFDPIHYLPLLERKIGALDQAAPLAGWELPEEFGVLRRLLESRMGRRGKREFVQVLRLMENFRTQEVYEGVSDALRLGAISFDAVKHLVLCRMEGRPQRLDLELYPYLPRVTVTKTSASDYMALMAGGRR